MKCRGVSEGSIKTDENETTFPPYNERVDVYGREMRLGSAGSPSVRHLVTLLSHRNTHSLGVLPKIFWEDILCQVSKDNDLEFPLDNPVRPVVTRYNNIHFHSGHFGVISCSLSTFLWV